MKLSNLYVRGLGVHLPPGRMTPRRAMESRLCGSEFTVTDLVGVAVAEETTAVEMAVLAASSALCDGGMDAKQIDLLIYAPMFQQGPDGWSPAGYILRELGCGEVVGHEISQGCNGGLAGLELAAGWLALAPEDATALVATAVHAEAAWLDRWRSPGHGIAIGDGAAAFILGKGYGQASVDSITSMTFSRLEGLHRGSLPLGEPANSVRRKVNVAARIREYAAISGDTPVDLNLAFMQMYSAVMYRSLEDAGIKSTDIARVIFANVGAETTAVSVMQPLDLPMSRSTWEFGRTIGHIGGGDHIAALDHLIRTRQVAAGDRVLLISGTAGFTVVSAVLTITGTTADSR
jgi:3-oxoacyl-[acyl-carrier-protein] synthase III